MARADGRGASVAIVEVMPERGSVPPGRHVMIETTMDVTRPGTVRLVVELLDLDEVVASVARRRHLAAGTTAVRSRLRTPPTGRRGYGVRVRAYAADRTLLSTGHAAIEAIAGWWESPRHVALIDHTDAGTRAVHDLRAWHVRVAQAYDWMWRHYRYEPPGHEDPFRDTLGRPVSHRALRATIRAATRHGIATLAYGSVYGAEPEHVAAHPDDRVFDERGEPLSLGGTFFINDIRPGHAWRRRLLGEYVAAMRRFGFAGIHMDTYGPPHAATGADGAPIVFRELYPGLIREAATEVGAIRGGRVLFNCVEGFPLEAVAPAPVAALYLELWPPDDRFGHLVAWIDRARAVAGARQVVIAAYGLPMRDAHAREERGRAFEATLLTTSVVGAAGAYHHTLAEGDRLLVEGYYPAAVRLRPGESRALRAAWRFGTRYVHLLTGTTRDEGLERSVTLRTRSGAPIPTSNEPKAGSVWVRASRTQDGRPVIQLVDLRRQVDDRWDAVKAPSPSVAGWRLSCPGLSQPVAASPWTSDGEPVRSRRVPGGWVLPPARRWLMVAESRGPALSDPGRD